MLTAVEPASFSEWSLAEKQEGDAWGRLLPDTSRAITLGAERSSATAFVAQTRLMDDQKRPRSPTITVRPES
jgi:hypothetical protein